MRGIEMSSTARSTSALQPALDRLGAVARLGHDAQVRLALEHEPQAAADDRVVVGEQDPGVEELVMRRAARG